MPYPSYSIVDAGSLQSSAYDLGDLTGTEHADTK